jgi:transcription elongation GreA/GreB family factor
MKVVADKLAALDEKLQDLAASAANETKSSAGDKYETARAMLHIEQDQVRAQKAELLGQQAVLNSIDPTMKTERIVLGSLVHIGAGYYYLSIALGKLQLDGQIIFALSLQAPLGKQLKGLRVDDKVTIGGKTEIVAELF